MPCLLLVPVACLREGIAEERVRVTENVDLERNVWVRRVKLIDRIDNESLADVTVGSLCAWRRTRAAVSNGECPREGVGIWLDTAHM